MARVHVELVSEPLDPAGLIQLVQDGSRGGVVAFLGDVRGVTGTAETLRLEYEAYSEMATVTMQEIAEKAAATFDANVAIVHRLGTLLPGETSVVCVAACTHRDAAFACARELIERLKSEVPIWKKEFGPDGAEWVANDPR